MELFSEEKLTGLVFGKVEVTPQVARSCMNPAPGRDHLATPSGLLFNELQKSPSTTLQAIEDMLPGDALRVCWGQCPC